MGGWFNGQIAGVAKQIDNLEAEIKTLVQKLDNLNTAITNLDNSTTKYNRWLIILTFVIAFLTLVMVIKMFVR